MIGKILEKKRVEMGISLTEMARKLNTSKQRLEQIEKNVTKNPGGIICLKLATEYKIPIITLLKNLGKK